MYTKASAIVLSCRPVFIEVAHTVTCRKGLGGVYMAEYTKCM